jgi:hypothetical protein
MHNESCLNSQHQLPQLPGLLELSQKISAPSDGFQQQPGVLLFFIFSTNPRKRSFIQLWILKGPSAVVNLKGGNILRNMFNNNVHKKNHTFFTVLDKCIKLIQINASFIFLFQD